MSWIPIVLLTGAAFALAAFAFRLERKVWTTLLAALVLGLAGYALQAHPDLAGSPRSRPIVGEQEQWASVEARKEMLVGTLSSGSAKVLIADGLTRQGQFANAAALLRSATQDNPADAEAWLALGNVLVEHADGALTPAAFFAYRRANETAPGSPAPGYFLGLALIRQGALLEARQVWAEALANTALENAVRPLMAERVARLDALLIQAGAMLPETPPSAPQ